MLLHGMNLGAVSVLMNEGAGRCNISQKAFSDSLGTLDRCWSKDSLRSCKTASVVQQLQHRSSGPCANSQHKRQGTKSYSCCLRILATFVSDSKVRQGSTRLVSGQCIRICLRMHAVTLSDPSDNRLPHMIACTLDIAPSCDSFRNKQITIHCEDATKFIDCTPVTLSDSTTYTVPDDLDCTAGAGQQRKDVDVTGTGVVISLLKTTAVTTLKNVRFVIQNGASVSFQLTDYPANSSGSLKL
eukprot:12797-Heterococcus_DN1.PRE.2